jgi:hypothetical protein
MNSGFVMFDGASPRLRGALEAQLGLEAARGLRQLLVYLLLAAALPVWIAAAWPDAVSSHFRTGAVSVWLIGLFSLLGAAVREHHWRRRLAAFTSTPPT